MSKLEFNGSNAIDMNIKGCIEETMLVGDIKGDYFPNYERQAQFLKELETLMKKYQIQKIDVGWKTDFSQQGE